MATRKSRQAEPAPAQGQQELTPAALPPAANDEARAAIATINAQLSEMDKVEAGLGVLEKRYAQVVYAVDTHKGMNEAVLARREIKGVRVDVEHARQAAKEPVLKLGREIDARAGSIKTRLLALETPIDEQIKAQEQAEEKRKADLERRITEIRETPARCIGKTSAELQEVLDAVESLPLADFEEYREQAAKAQFDAGQSVRTLLQQAKNAEELAELQAKQRKDQERKGAIQQAIAAIGAPLQQLPMCRTSARVQALIDTVQALPVPDTFYEEFAPAAREKKAAVLAELTAARDEKKAAEDARAAAAAAPAPTPAPTAAPAAAAPAFPSVQPITRVEISQGRSVDSDFRKVFGGERPPVRAPQADVDQDPFSAPAPSTAGLTVTELAISNTPRPSDAEMLAVLADHYEVEAATAALWLRTFDADAALQQLPLQMA